MKNIKKDCYKLFQIIVVERDKVCQRPGCEAPCTAGHHVFGRNKMGSAFETDSGLGFCYEDHDHWVRLHPFEVKKLLEAKVGSARYNELVRLSNEVCRWRDADYLDAAARLGVELIETREKKREAGNG